MSEAPHILVVDDDREIRTLLSDYLQKNGYRVTAVAEGKAMRRTLVSLAGACHGDDRPDCPIIDARESGAIH